MTGSIRYAEAFLTGVLGSFGMDIDYVRAQGNTLYHLDEAGNEVPVLDLVSGWGSLILGHNHPEIVAHAKALLDAGSPVHAQFSLHPVADQVGALLNEILHREFPGSEAYSIIFANSGAEAIEAAVKHAELDRALRVRDLFDEIEWNLGAALAAVRDGTARLPDDLSLLPDGGPVPTNAAELETVFGALVAHNLTLASGSPVFFALERAFHGKLVGSTQLTHNPTFRLPFASLGLAARFVPPDDPAVFEKIVEEERVAVLDVAVVDGKVALIERDFPIVAGFVLEPIQGEGGIHALTADFAKRLRKICDEIACPVIVDEIQSGMGRTGAFFASAHIGLLGDYYTIGKSLGGGLGKVSAMLVRQSRYRAEFELVHSSTFAKDGFSTAIALRTLRILEADGGKAYRLAEERGARIMGMFRALAAEFPDVIADVRGKGLLIGLEYADQSTAPSAIIREKAVSGLLSFLLASYLQAQGIRTGPTASSPNMLRIEPSIYISDKEIDLMKAAFTRLCRILRHQDALPLVHSLTSPRRRPPRAETKDFRAGPDIADTAAGEPADRKVGFVSYLLTLDMVRDYDPSLAELDDDDLVSYARRCELLRDMLPVAPVRFDSPLGTSVDLTVYPLLVTTRQLREYQVSGQTMLIRADVNRRVRTAVADGCEIVGLGFGLAGLTGRERALRVPKVAITSGSALALGSAMNAMESVARERFGGFDRLTLAIVGGGGHIGSAAGVLGADRVSRIVLVGSGRDGSSGRLRAAAHRIYQESWTRIAAGGPLSGIPAHLSAEPLIVKWLAEGRAADTPSGEAIAEYLADSYDNNPFVVISDHLSAVQGAELVLAATSTPEVFMSCEYLRDGAVVCDLNISGMCQTKDAGRTDLRYVRAGVLATPNGASLPTRVRGPLQDGEVFVGMAESIVWGLASPGHEHSDGALTGSRVRAVADLAERHGFRPIFT